MNRRTPVVTVAAALLAVLMLSMGIAAQIGTSTVKGTVVDPHGNPIPGAAVRLIREEGSARTTATNNSGSYTFSSLQTGTYQLDVEVKGFKKSSIANVKALVDNSTEINVSMEIGGVSETVNVDAAGLESIVNTTDASLGNNFVSRQILEMPLQARNVTDLLSLQPGVTPDGSVTGGRSDQANITLDGIDVNNQQNAVAFDPVLRVNPDSVEEFRVITSNADATKGRSSGAQVSLITRSGSNEFHGALYEYHRNTATTANDWFSNAAGHLLASDPLVINGFAKAGDPVSPRGQLLRNNFGGRLGGPIIKNRLFFFYNYEGMREAKTVAVVRQVPTSSFGAGQLQFRDTTGAIRTLDTAALNSLTLLSGTTPVPVVDVNPIVVGLFSSVNARYPNNYPQFGDGLNTGGFRFNAPVPVDLNGHTARFDWNVTSDQKHTVSFLRTPSRT